MSDLKFKTRLLWWPAWLLVRLIVLINPNSSWTKTPDMETMIAMATPLFREVAWGLWLLILLMVIDIYLMITHFLK